MTASMIASRPFFLLASFLLLYLIGIGPALFLVSRSFPQRLACAFCLAPAVGLVFLTMLLALPVYSDHPLATVALPVTVIAVAVSIGLVILDVQRRYHEYQQMLNIKAILLILLTATVIFFALILPMFGGIDH